MQPTQAHDSHTVQQQPSSNAGQYRPTHAYDSDKFGFFSHTNKIITTRPDPEGQQTSTQAHWVLGRHLLVHEDLLLSEHPSRSFKHSILGNTTSPDHPQVPQVYPSEIPAGNCTCDPRIRITHGKRIQPALDHGFQNFAGTCVPAGHPLLTIAPENSILL